MCVDELWRAQLFGADATDGAFELGDEASETATAILTALGEIAEHRRLINAGAVGVFDWTPL